MERLKRGEREGGREVRDSGGRSRDRRGQSNVARPDRDKRSWAIEPSRLTALAGVQHGKKRRRSGNEENEPGQRFNSASGRLTTLD